MITAYIGLGSNLGHPITEIIRARDSIAQSDRILEFRFSSLYKSWPMGPPDQPDYVNAVMSVGTTLAALEMLHFLQSVEQNQGRVRNGERWGPRTIDLDLLLYGREIIETDELVVPHYGLTQRAFVLYPLAELSPDLHIPGHGHLERLLESCPRDGLQLMS